MGEAANTYEAVAREWIEQNRAHWWRATRWFETHIKK